MKCFYEKNGLFFVAMTPVRYQRRRDLSPKAVAKRENNARFFKPGWDLQVASMGLIVRLDYKEEDITIYMVESNAVALVMGSKPKSVEKNLEIMRYLRHIPVTAQYIPELFGYTRSTTRKPVTISDILDIESLAILEEEVEILDLPDLWYGDYEDPFELPQTADDQYMDCLF